MRFRLRQMEVFRAVMLTGSINAAARMLLISQPAVSRIVAHTESVLGLTLFNRARGKLVPTEEARRLLNEVNRLYDAALSVDDFAQRLAVGAAGTLSFCASPSLGFSLVPDAIGAFSRLHPGVAVEFNTRLLSEATDAVLAGRAEFAVTVLPLEHPHLLSVPFATGRMVCAMPAGHGLAGSDVVSLADMAPFPLVMHSRQIAFGRMVAEAFERCGLSVDVRCTVFETQVACSLVRAGVGLAVVDEYTVRGGLWPGLTIRPLAEALPLRPSFVHALTEGLGVNAQRFLALLTKAAAVHNAGT